jgi:hypothetical protein
MMEAAPVKKRGRKSTKPPAQPSGQGTTVAKHPGGRPTKYEDWMVEAMLTYFTKEVGNFPTLAGFSASIGVSRDTLHDWATAKDVSGNLRNPEFSYAYKRAKELQEENLVLGALTGKYNATFAIFTAKNVLGWRDKVEQEITGKDGGPLAGIQVMFVNPDGTDRDTEH